MFKNEDIIYYTTIIINELKIKNLYNDFNKYYQSEDKYSKFEHIHEIIMNTLLLYCPEFEYEKIEDVDFDLWEEIENKVVECVYKKINIGDKMLNDKQKQYIAEKEFQVLKKPENKNFYEEELSEFYDDVGFSGYYGEMVWNIIQPTPKTKCELFHCLHILENDFHRWWVSDFARKLEEDYPQLIENYWDEIKKLGSDNMKIEQMLNECRNLKDGAKNRSCIVDKYKWGYQVIIPYYEFKNSFMWVKVNGSRFKIRSIEIQNENICFMPEDIGGSDINVAFDEFESFEIISCYKGNR